MRILICQHTDHKYESEDGYILQREYGKTPNGNDLNGRWVYRDPQGEMIDFDQYRNDLAERYAFKLANITYMA